MIRDIKNLFEQEKDYYKPGRVANLYRNNYIKYENNGDRNKTASVKEYLDEIKPYLKDIIVNLQIFDFVFDCCIKDDIDSSDWIEKKKAIVNRITYDDKCFQYAATVALNHEEILTENE